jgi:hypothetical protein
MLQEGDNLRVPPAQALNIVVFAPGDMGQMTETCQASQKYA